MFHKFSEVGLDRVAPALKYGGSGLSGLVLYEHEWILKTISEGTLDTSTGHSAISKRSGWDLELGPGPLRHLLPHRRAHSPPTSLHLATGHSYLAKCQSCPRGTQGGDLKVIPTREL